MEKPVEKAMECLWKACGMPVESLWNACGKPVECLWNIYIYDSLLFRLLFPHPEYIELYIN
jgi:hypothetical protein